ILGTGSVKGRFLPLCRRHRRCPARAAVPETMPALALCGTVASLLLGAKAARMAPALPSRNSVTSPKGLLLPRSATCRGETACDLILVASPPLSPATEARFLHLPPRPRPLLPSGPS